LQVTTCYPGLPTPKAAAKSGPVPARRGAGLGYADGAEAEVRRVGESVTYTKAPLGPADGKNSPSPVPTAGGVAPVAPKPLGAIKSVTKVAPAFKPAATGGAPLSSIKKFPEENPAPAASAWHSVPCGWESLLIPSRVDA